LNTSSLATYARLGLVGIVMYGVVTWPCDGAWAKILRQIDADGVIWFTNIPSTSGDGGASLDTPRAKQPSRALRVQSHPYRMEVDQLARRHGLSPNLVSALMAVESDFDPTAVSPKGAQGLMQLMPLIARHYRVYNPLNPQENIEGGIRFLSDLLQLFDNQLPLALAAYNGGEGLVRKHGGVPPMLESYVNKVLALYEQTRGMPIHRYIMPSGLVLFSNVPLSQEQLSQWDVKR
jgi:soluble lytic murein transglycosylase-like protein